MTAAPGSLALLALAGIVLAGCVDPAAEGRKPAREIACAASPAITDRLAATLPQDDSDPKPMSAAELAQHAKPLLALRDDLFDECARDTPRMMK